MLEPFLNKITQGDCLDLLRKIPDASIDVTFADPPFNLKKKYTSTRDNLVLQDYLAWCEMWLGEMVRVTKPSGSIFVHNIPKWLTYYAGFLNRVAHFKHWIAWDAPTQALDRLGCPHLTDGKIAPAESLRHFVLRQRPAAGDIL